MRLFIADRTGTGTRSDAFRPDVPKGERVGAYELPDGRFLCVAPNVTALPARVTDLGADETARMTTARQNAVADGLGLARGDLVDLTIGEAIMALEGVKLAGRNNRMKVRIAGVDLLDSPAIRGGATDAFTYSNGNLATVSSSAWAVVENDCEVKSNAVVWEDNQFRVSRYATAFSGDHYSEFTYTFAGDSEVAAVLRCSAVTNSYFYGYVHITGTGELVRFDAGSATVLDTTSEHSSGTMRGESVGSVQTFKRNGVELMSATDSTHNALTYVGIGGYGVAANGVVADDWSGGQLSAAAPGPTSRAARPHPLIFRGRR
jgi:hypothetical protein